MSDYGLVAAVAPEFFLGTAVLLVGFVLGLWDRDVTGRWIVAHLVLLALALHGLPGLVEPHPRFPTAWLHVGFADHIAQHGTLLDKFDARFNWAGFFSGVALLERAAGTQSALWLVRFTPVGVNLFACWAIMLIGRSIGIERRQAAFAAGLFLVVNWSGQDYFSPQATAFCLYTVVLAVVLAIYSRSSRIPEPCPVRSIAHPGAARYPLLAKLYAALKAFYGEANERSRSSHEPPVADRAKRLGLAGVGTVAVAVAMSHQLSPFFLTSALMLLAVTGVSRLRALPVAVLVVTLAWISFAAEPYWTGHLQELTSSVGRITDLAQRNVGVRLATTNTGHAAAVMARIVLAASVWLGAVLVLALSLAAAFVHRRRAPLALPCLFIAPFPLFFLQAYGGEMVIRVFLFSLPPAVLAIALAAVPRSRVPGIFRRGLPGVVLAAVVPLFLLARYGNEAFERVDDDDRRVVAALLNMAPPGSTVYVLNPHTLLHSGRVADVRFSRLRAVSGGDVETLLQDAPGTDKFLLLTEGQEAYGEMVEGRPNGWVDDLAQDLDVSDELELSIQSGDSRVYRVRP
ncbi:MAG: hypothetical protein M3N47_00385 [Chloroflexota bacterium]|nr:hypothetical protein [Chloroflexota bacterium]